VGDSIVLTGEERRAESFHAYVATSPNPDMHPTCFFFFRRNHWHHLLLKIVFNTYRFAWRGRGREHMQMVHVAVAIAHDEE
jgi:hypothetical protein